MGCRTPAAIITYIYDPLNGLVLAPRRSLTTATLATQPRLVLGIYACQGQTAVGDCTGQPGVVQCHKELENSTREYYDARRRATYHTHG
jgi:hypothetical protein